MKKIILISLLLPFLTACGVEQVDEGYRGIKRVWGKVEGEPLTPDIYFYNPFSTDIFEMEVREQKFENSTQAFTKDTQNVNVSYAVTYYPDPAKIGQIYSQFGGNWEEKVLAPAILGSMKDSIGQYKADDLIAKRGEVKTSVQKELTEALLARGVTVTRLDLTNLDFENAYEAAVEKKVVAIQKALEAKNKTVEVEELAKQKIAAAEGDSKATVLNAKAEAESMRIRAKALTQNKSLVEYEAVQRWNGQLPQYILGSGAMPFINLDKMVK